MKLKQLVLGVALNLALFSTAAHADIILQSQKAGGNVCDNIPGAWSGTGTVSATILFKFTCVYHGTGIVIPKSTPNSYDFKMSLQKTSGLCPASKEVVLPGFCDPVAGRLVLDSQDVHLTGMISPDGKLVDRITGKIAMTVLNQTINADVEKMELHKQ